MKRGKFEFDQKLASTFDSLLPRSIPLYEEVHRQLLLIIDHIFPGPGLSVCDLGCSTGATLELIYQKRKGDCHLVGLDLSRPMIEQARKKPMAQVAHLHVADLLEAPLPSCDLFVANYTLQFLPVEKRGELLKKVRQALNPGGLLFLSEKLASPHTAIEESCEVLHDLFRLGQGLGQEEIHQKKRALQGVLIPLSAQQNQQLLEEALFGPVEMIFRWANFGSFLAFPNS